MDTAVIVVIAIVLLVVLAALAMTFMSKGKRDERRLKAERQRAAEHHRAEAEQRKSRAALAEQRAEEARLEADRVASEARLEREQANLHEGRADLHERGLADHELETGRRMHDADGDGRPDQEVEHARTQPMEHVVQDDGSSTGTGATRADLPDQHSTSRGRFSRDGGERERFEEELATGGPDEPTARRPSTRG